MKKSLELLAPYLTSSAGGISSPYEEGGALYALGLIHSPVCHDNPVRGEPPAAPAAGPGPVCVSRPAHPEKYFQRLGIDSEGRGCL